MIQSRIQSKPHSAALISVVLPAYNEAAALGVLVDRLDEAFVEIGYDYELIFVDDGSTDGSDEVLDSLAAADSRVKVLHLSRNFGHQAALLAGLQHARGDAIVVMDSDLDLDFVMVMVTYLKSAAQ